MAGTSELPVGREFAQANGDDPVSDFAVTIAWSKRTVSICGVLDVATVPELGGVVTRVLARAPGDIELDVSGLTFIDAAGLGQIAEFARRLSVRGACLTVRGASRRARRIFLIGGLDGLLSPNDDRDALPRA